MRVDDLRVIILARACHPWHGVGGLERHVHDLTRHLLARGVRVTLIMPPPADPAAAAGSWFDDARLTVRTVPYRTFPFAGRRGTTVLDRSTAYPVFGWRAGRLAHRLVERGDAQIVHGHGASALGYARGRIRDRLGTAPLVFNPHGLEEFGAAGPGRAVLKQLAYRPLQAAVRACARAADRVLATDTVLVPAVMAHLGVPRPRVAVVPNAVDLAALDARPADCAARRRALGLGADDDLLVAVGRLEANKGFDVLIEALARLAPAAPAAGTAGGAGTRPPHLAIVGDGPQRGVLARQVQAAGLGDRVHLVGRAPDDDLQAWYAAATLFVHPTLYEGSSLVTLEAMARRCAVVASAAGGIPDKVQPGVTGWLVPPGDAAALAAALRTALAHRARLPAMGVAGRVLVERRFAWRSVVDRLLEVYREVLARG